MKELEAGKLGWARASCDRGLALSDVDPNARPALLYNEGLIAKHAGDSAAARSYFEQSLALRGRQDPGRALVEKALRSVGGETASPESKAVGSPAGDLECRTKSGERTVELLLTWDRNLAVGSLRTTERSGVAAARPVKAELYKGLILVNPADAPDPAARIATMQTETRTIQIGNYEQPWLPCDRGGN